MKNLFSSRRVYMVTGFLALLIPFFLFALVHATEQTILLPNGQQGVIDWSEGRLRAVGQAVAPSNATSEAQKEVLARRGAILDGQRMLIEMIKGLQLTADTTMINLMANDVVRSRVEGSVQGAVMIQSNWDGSIYTVELQIPLSEVRDTTGANSTIKPTPETPTGLIIDARGLNITPALFISLFDQSGVEVLSGLSALYNPALPVDTTLPDPINQAKSDPRVGDRPMIIKAAGVMDNQIDLIIPNGFGSDLRQITLSGNPFSAANTLIIAN